MLPGSSAIDYFSLHDVYTDAVWDLPGLGDNINCYASQTHTNPELL